MILVIIIFFNSLFTQQLYINEIVSDNDNVVFDFEGDNPDWLEIYNPNDFDVNLLNYTLSDKLTDPFKWTFPDVTIKAKEYLVIFCSEKDTLVNGELHTNFKISSDGEKIFLYDDGIKLKDKKRLDFIEIPPLTENQAYGKLPDGNGKLSYLSKNSPGETNHYSDEIICSIESGFYETDTIEVELKSTMGYEIRYTLDGTDPDENSPLYTEPIKLGNSSQKENNFANIKTSPPEDKNFYKSSIKPKNNLDKLHNLRYVSIKNNSIASTDYINSYYINKNEFKVDMPIFSILTDSTNLFGNNIGNYIPGVFYDSTNSFWTGNYFHYGKYFEYPAKMIYFESNKEHQFTQNIKFSIHGGGTRTAAQKSIRLIGRNLNGPDEFDFKLTNSPYKTYKRLNLKTTMGIWWWWSIALNELVYEITEDLNFEKYDYRPSIVFINGEYWGIHTMTQHGSKHFFSEYHNNHIDSIDVVYHHQYIAARGNMEQYEYLINFIENNDLYIENNYNHVKNLIDIESFIDYFAFQIFAANFDWPQGNIKAWKPKSHEYKWRWILYDLDAAFYNSEVNMFERLSQDEHSNWPNGKESTFLFRKLFENKEFAVTFKSRFEYLVDNDFSFQRTTKLYEDVKALYSSELLRHFYRWDYPEEYDKNWQNTSDSIMLSFLEKRPDKVLEHLEDFMEMSSYDLELCPENQCDNNRVTLFPNPTNGEFSIKTDSKFKVSNLTIYSSVGKVVKILTNEIISENKIFNLSDLPNGIYFIKFENNLGQFTFEKLIINK